MLPFVQVEADFITSKAPRIAALAGIPRALALGHSVELIAFIVPETSTDETPPDGVLLDPDAPTILEAVVGWTGEPGRLFSAWVRGGLVEKLEVGARVRGLDRYREAWDSAKRSRDRAAKWREAKRTRTVPAPNAYATPPERVRTPGDVDGDGDGDVDGDLLPSEVKEERESASPPAADAAPPEPVERVEDLQSAWNSLAAPPLPRWQETGKKRRIAALARLRERPLVEWRAIIERIAASNFCRGGNDRGWAAGPDFLLRPDTAAKVLEGTYDNRGRARPGRQADLTAGASAPPEGECVVCGGPGEVGFALGRLCYHDYAIWMDTPVVRASERPYELEGEFKAWLDERRRELEAA